MRDFTTVLATTAAGFILLGGVGCSQEGGGGAGAPAADEESAEFAAMEYRHGLMHVLAFKVGVLRDMAEGTIDADASVFAESAADLAAAAGMITEGFIPNSDTESLTGSAALPGIWEDFNDFVQKAADLEEAAQDVADQAAVRGFTVGAESADPIGPACGGCHRVYRQRDD